MFSHLSDPLPLNSDRPESSTLSDSGTARRASNSDEEVLLATSRPKKRAGRRVFKETRHPIYRGVRSRNTDKWVCELREPNKQKRIWLGTYPTPEMAARAHDVAALAFKGKSACLNFADSAWRLPVPASKDAKGIRKTAKEAAEAFRPHEPVPVVSDEENVSKASPEVSCGSYEVAIKFAPENGTYMDEEAVFDLPGLLANMAEGMLLSPPPLVMGDDDYHSSWADEEACDVGLSLWSFSI